MPELPEVETVRRVIEPQITGRSIGSVTIRRNEIIAHPDAGKFVSLIAGKSIRGMYRRGKFLIIILEGNDTIVIHLRMTGSLIAAPADYPEEKHTHIIFHLGDGMELRFSDQRRFGRLWLIGKDEHDSYTGLSKLGLEPSDSRLDAAYLKGASGIAGGPASEASKPGAQPRDGPRTSGLERGRGGRNSRCSGGMRRYREEHRWRRQPSGPTLTLRRESWGSEQD